MKIFISYRRDDSAGYAGRLYDYLTRRFGDRNVFMDIDTIEPGQDFRKAIENAVGTCDVALIMIGRQWLSATDPQGGRRLDDPGDWVRAEIAAALANPSVRVIPVLVRGASMPGPQELPDDLKELAWRNAIELSDQRFQYDANRLIGVIESLEVQPAKMIPGGKFELSTAKRGKVNGLRERWNAIYEYSHEFASGNHLFEYSCPFVDRYPHLIPTRILPSLWSFTPSRRPVGRMP